jgi:hydrogenase expression/formation protein HypE
MTLDCPVPRAGGPRIELAHGGGGRRMRRLVREVFAAALGPLGLDAARDAALLDAPPGRLAFTTDAFVVSPRFFPGGDIGTLAVYGTVNDLATAGAHPLCLSAAFVLEEGLPIDELVRIVASMAAAAAHAGVRIVTGDTKVVPHGQADGVYITTTGVGAVPSGLDLGPHAVVPGDAILVSGDVGRHGVAILSVREGLGFETALASDCAPVHGLAASLLAAGATPHCLRDPTRGGLAAVLVEIAADASVDLDVDEGAVPVAAAVASACELLGLDAIHLPCEGRLVAFVPAAQAGDALAAWRARPDGATAARIGTVAARGRGEVHLATRLGTPRVLDLPSGEQLPRIC